MFGNSEEKRMIAELQRELKELREKVWALEAEVAPFRIGDRSVALGS